MNENMQKNTKENMQENIKENLNENVQENINENMQKNTKESMQENIKEKTCILERDKAGEVITLNDEGYDVIATLIEEAQKTIAELNCSYHSADEVRTIFSSLTGVIVDSSFELLPPFYTDFGKNIRVGKNVFINHACTFMDRGGITIGDNVLIAPKVNLITINHPLDIGLRRGTISKPINIGNNVWIGIGATIMPNISIGENSVIAAGAVVSKDVPPNVVVAGVPARIIKRL